MEQLFIPIALVGVAVGIAVGFAVAVRGARGRASVGARGAQEMEIVVLDGFKPSTVIVREGIPVRLKFSRLDNAQYSGRVVFSGLRLERRLPPFRSTLVEFLPPQPGEYLFTSDMGMYRGKLIVEKASRGRIKLPWQSGDSEGVASKTRGGEKTQC